MQILASRGDVNVWVSDRNHDDEFRSLELNHIYVCANYSSLSLF